MVLLVIQIQWNFGIFLVPSLMIIPTIWERQAKSVLQAICFNKLLNTRPKDILVGAWADAQIMGLVVSTV